MWLVTHFISKFFINNNGVNVNHIHFYFRNDFGVCLSTFILRYLKKFRYNNDGRTFAFRNALGVCLFIFTSRKKLS